MSELNTRIKQIGKMLTNATLPTSYISVVNVGAYDAEVQAVINAYTPPLSSLDFEAFTNSSEQDMIDNIIRKHKQMNTKCSYKRNTSTE